MNDIIGAVMDSEYNNVGDLMGIDTALLGEISGSIDNMSTAEKVKFLRKLSGKQMGSRGSRAEFEKFFKEVPDGVKENLLNGNLRLADYTIYSIKQINSKTIKMFETQDDKEIGLRNISNAKLPKNFVFLVSGIYLLAGTIPVSESGGSDPSNKEKQKAIDFRSVRTFPTIANGEFTLKANKKQIVPEGSIIRKFITDNNTFVPLGYYKLDNPRLIKDDELIEFIVELGTMEGITPNHFLYVGLDGTGTTP